MLNGQMAQLPNIIQDSFGGGVPGINFGSQSPQLTYNQPQKPQATYSNGAPYSRQEAFAAMTAKNGGAPTKDMVSGINAYGRPINVMDQHRDQMIKNRKDEISNVYQDMLGRAATQDERKAGSMSGLDANEYYDKLSGNQEFLQRNQNELAAFNPQYYLEQNKDVAASPWASNPEEHFNRWGKSEGRSPFDPSNVTYDMGKATSLAQKLRSNALGNKEIAGSPDYINQIGDLKKQIDELKNAQASGSSNSNDFYSG